MTEDGHHKLCPHCYLYNMPNISLLYIRYSIKFKIIYKLRHQETFMKVKLKLQIKIIDLQIQLKYLKKFKLTSL